MVPLMGSKTNGLLHGAKDGLKSGKCKQTLRDRLCGSESESDIASRRAHRESNLMFALSIDKDQRKNSLSRSLSFSVNKPIQGAVI